MKAIVVTDQAAGPAGMKLVERPEPSAAINDVIVQIHASGYVPTETEWPSTWTDRRDRDRTPSILGHARACRSRASPRGRDCSSTATFRRGRASSRTARQAQSGRW
jgi:hypothetical protein